MDWLNFGGGVNSVAIMAAVEMKLLPRPDYVVFADTGGEKAETYNYMIYFKDVSPLPIITIQTPEGRLLDYCDKNNILPQRFMRWCTDRWKRRPLDRFRKAHGFKDGDKIWIGIAKDEEGRAHRWRNDTDVRFPLLELGWSRADCIKAIKKVGWCVPAKSGCFFCPFAKLDEFAELKANHPDQWEFLVKLEKRCLKHLTKCKVKGWYDDKYTLPELLDRKRPETCSGQMCLYCWG